MLIAPALPRCEATAVHPRKRSSPKSFDERPPPARIGRHQQENADCCQVLWQLAIGTGIHIANERGDRVSKIVSVEIIEGSLLAPLDIFVARHVSYQGTIQFGSPIRPILNRP
jgi:hypothetical protein